MTMLSVSSALDSVLIGPEQRVVILCQNETLAAACFLAALLKGAVPVMLHAGTPTERASGIVEITQCVALLSDNSDVICGGLCAHIPVQLARAPRLNLRPLWKRGTAKRLLINPNTDANTLAYLLFTSGTTSAPAGVEITHRALHAHLKTLARLFDYGPTDTIANPTPLAHTDGLVHGLLVSVFTGATLLRQGDFHIEAIDRWMNLLAEYGATHFITNPTVLRLLMKSAPHDDYFSLPAFRAVISSAATLHDEVWKSFVHRFKCTLYNLYGMTETVANATYAGDHPEMGAIGTIGKPIDCIARLRDTDTQTLVETGVGEIELSGDNICRGYWRNTDRTRESFTGDGWFKTGDLAEWSQDGSLIFRGRAKTVILSGGLTIVPEEIDEALLRHPDVLEAVTVGVPREEFEEIAVTGVVLRTGANTSVEQLFAHARAHLEPMKVPKRIQIVTDAIPRGPSGKPDFVAVRRLLADAPVESSAPNTCLDSVLNVAARVFHVEVSTLNANTGASDLAVWDSFNHITLMVEAERTFGVSLPTTAIVNIKNLGDLVRAIEDARR